MLANAVSRQKLDRVLLSETLINQEIWHLDDVISWKNCVLVEGFAVLWFAFDYKESKNLLRLRLLSY